MWSGWTYRRSVKAGLEWPMIRARLFASEPFSIIRVAKVWRSMCGDTRRIPAHFEVYRQMCRKWPALTGSASPNMYRLELQRLAQPCRCVSIRATSGITGTLRMPFFVLLFSTRRTLAFLSQSCQRRFCSSPRRRPVRRKVCRMNWSRIVSCFAASSNACCSSCDSPLMTFS